jgi:hypothetical protein
LEEAGIAEVTEEHHEVAGTVEGIEVVVEVMRLTRRRGSPEMAKRVRVTSDEKNLYLTADKRSVRYGLYGRRDTAKGNAKEKQWFRKA